MATVPSIRTWVNELLTATKMTEISAMLEFLRDCEGGLCTARATAQKFIGNTTDTLIDFGAADPNVDGMWNPSAPSRVTAHTAGWYALSGVVTFTTGAGTRFGKFKKNGTTLRAASMPAPSGGVEAFLDMSLRVVYLAVNDYVELTAWQNTGGTIATSIADGGSQISVIRLAS